MDVSASAAHWIMALGMGLTWCAAGAVICWQQRTRLRRASALSRWTVMASPQEQAWREYQQRAAEDWTDHRRTFNAGMQAGFRFAVSQLELDLQARAFAPESQRL
jgi:hypothetical protein